MSILIKDAENSEDIYIEGNHIKEIGTNVTEADKVIDATGKAVLPGLANTHTHGAMSLLRSYADDMQLQEWLEEKIWPVESKLTSEDVYLGTKLACLEMIKSGTTVFADMYFHMEDAARAAEELGLRSVMSYGFIDLNDADKREQEIKKTKEFVESVEGKKLIKASLGPHSVYTVSDEGWDWIKEYSEEKDLLVHTHLSETRKENEECVEDTGKRPTSYLNDLGVLNERLLAAHGCWLTRQECKTLGSNGVSLSYNPCSNMKLASGGVMPFPWLDKFGVNVCLGTDGAASNNNLDLFEEMKFASLLQKNNLWDATVLPAERVWRLATRNGYRALDLDGGVLEEGWLADLIVVDLGLESSCPGHDLYSDLVYSVNGSCVDSTIVNGKVVMENRKVGGEEKILKEAREQAKDLVNR